LNGVRQKLRQIEMPPSLEARVLRLLNERDDR
jgi:hypothetical protein